MQYRINGIRLPDGVSGFSQVLDTSFIRSLSLIDGALPAEYGLRTAGLIDIVTRNGADNPGTTAGIYGGQYETLLPTVSTSGVSGRWDYFFTGRFDTNQLGIENETPGHDAIHDRNRQGRYFAYASTPLDDGTRFTFMSGASIAKYQIPNQPGVTAAFTAFGVGDFDSTQLNENQVERSIFNILALQKSIGPLDAQISYFQRYSTLHFVPDQVGDLRVQRCRLRREPGQPGQRHPERHRLSPEPAQHAPLRLHHRGRTRGSGEQFDGAAAQRRRQSGRCAVLPRQRGAEDRRCSPASTPRTSTS